MSGQLAHGLDYWTDRRNGRRTKTERKQEMVGVLTGERLLVAFSHGYEVPQAGIELLHDGLERGEKKQHVWLVK